MSEIPEDLRAIGLALFERGFQPSSDDVATLIQNERARCADIAELAAVRAELYGADAVQRVCTEVHRAINHGHAPA